MIAVRRRLRPSADGRLLLRDGRIVGALDEHGVAEIAGLALLHLVHDDDVHLVAHGDDDDGADEGPSAA